MSLSKITENDYERMFRDFDGYLVDEYNEQRGNLDKIDGIDCQKCRNKGWIRYKKGTYITDRRCDCMKLRKNQKEIVETGLGGYLTKDFDDYIVDEEWQRKVKEIAQDYTNKHLKDNVWFMALGQSGSGKTLICSIISNYLLLIAKREVKYVIWTDFIGQLKREVMGDKTSVVSDKLSSIKKVDVLFLDEVLKKYNETDLKYLMEIINYRYSNDLKTIITSENLVMTLLEIDQGTFGRALEKSQGYVVSIAKDRNKNYRLKNLVINGEVKSI